VAGIPGSGKSTIGRALAGGLHAVLLDQDTATNPLMARIAELVGAGDDLDHPGMRGAVREARYRCLIDVAAENVSLGSDVVMVAPFTSEVRDPTAWAAMTAVLPVAQVRLVWVRISPAAAAERRRARGMPRDVAAELAGGSGEAHVEAVPLPAMAHILADGTADARIEADRLVALLTAPPNG
jgi:predicted kinase